MTNEDKKGQNGVVKCCDVQSALFDFMSRELGEGRADVVRDHLEKCPDCQRVAAEMEATFKLMHHAAETETDIPKSLSDKHRARLVRAVLHPVLDWIYVHHRLVSVLVTILVLLGMLSVVRRLRIWYREDVSGGITVTIGHGRPDERPLIGRPSRVETNQSEPVNTFWDLYDEGPVMPMVPEPKLDNAVPPLSGEED